MGSADLPIALISQAGGILALLAVIWWRAAANEKAIDKLSEHLAKQAEKLDSVYAKMLEGNGHDIKRLEQRVDEIGRNVHGLSNSLTVFMGNIALERKLAEGKP